jgi:hypothetical protein
VPDLIASIEDYLRVTNANPKPLIWTASAESILEKVPEEESPSTSQPKLRHTTSIRVASLTAAAMATPSAFSNPITTTRFSTL